MIKQRHFRACVCSSHDGTYLIPMIKSGTANRFISVSSPFFAAVSNPIKIICDEGESSVRRFEVSLFSVENTRYGDLKGIFVGIYRVGVRNPIWFRMIDEEVSYEHYITFVLDEMELGIGRYFILLGNIAPYEELSYSILDFAGCHRINFLIVPNGKSLRHPALTAYDIRYIDPDDKEYYDYCRRLNHSMTVYDSPIYELEIGLDSVPDPYIDRYDMWIFDDAKSLFTKIPDMIHKPTEKIRFAAPYGLARGTVHIVIYHNGIPLFHFHCRRIKRLGKLKVETVTPESIFWYLHKNKSLRIYGSLKNKIFHVLKNPEILPDCVCIIDEKPSCDVILDYILEDLYPSKAYIKVYNSDRNLAEKIRNLNIPDGAGVVVLDLNYTSESLWNGWCKCIEEFVRNGKVKAIIYGFGRKVSSLFSKCDSISRFIPAENRWHTGPVSDMEKVYITINEMSSDSNYINNDLAEKLYDKFVNHRG